MALDRGHYVVAYVRAVSRFHLQHERLTVVEGGLTDAGKLERAVAGSGAVISALGPGVRAKGRPIAAGTGNIVAAMARTGVRRLIVMATPSAADPKDLPDRRIQLLVWGVRLVLRGAYADVVGVAEAVRASGIDWTIVRVSLLTSGRERGRVRVGYPGRGQVGLWISRADLARFLVGQVEDCTYLRQAPLVSN